MQPQTADHSGGRRSVSPLAPEPILRAVLYVVQVAASTTRNWTRTDQVSRQQIYD